MHDSNTRQRLRVAIKLMLAVAVIAVLYVFGAAFFSPERRESSPDAMSVGVGQLKPGETIKVNWDGRAILIHRRTPSEMQWLSQAQGGLSDAASSRSSQPGWALNAHRSRAAEWFVALAVREDKACTIDFDSSRDEGGYISSCDGIRFDSAGRHFAGQPGPAVLNMRVPIHDLSGEVMILGGHNRQ